MVCPRDIYANDRTLEAGIRTSLALFAFGILIIKFDTNNVVIGTLFNILGILQLIYSQTYYLIQIKKFKNPDTIFEGVYINFQIIISTTIIVTMIVLFSLLLNKWIKQIKFI